MATKKEVTRKDPNTGEVIVVNRPSAVIVAPDPAQVNTARAVAGRNPPAKNLRDHKEFAGQMCMILGARIANGDTGEYVLATALIYPEGEQPTEEHAIILMTGSSNILDRVVTAMQTDALPMVGKLRNEGRAWFLD